MTRTTPSTTHIARSARCLLVAATLTATTALVGGGLQNPTAAHAATASSLSGTVQATDAIYGPGYAPMPTGGTMPPAYAVPPGSPTVTFPSVTGTWSISGGCAPYGPNGGGCYNGTSNITAYGGISGFIDSTPGQAVGALVGLFLTNATPTDPPPPTVDWTNQHNLATYSPAIAQVFFIGDGTSTSGGLEQIQVPLGATRLFLGMADAYGYQGTPTAYWDNSGSLNATIQFADAPITASPACPSNSTEAFSNTTATFTDASTAGTLSDFSASVDWGDGVTSTGTIAGGPGTSPYTVSGSHAYTTTGYTTVTTTITDVGGQTTSTSCKVLVGYGTGGYLQPVNDTAHSETCAAPCPMSVFKSGQTIPFRFQIMNASGALVEPDANPVTFTATLVSTTTLAIDESTVSVTPDTGATFIWDGTGYRYNWQSPSNSSGDLYLITATFASGQTISVNIALR